jgi:ataxia telangiectasia mutated family protein
LFSIIGLWFNYSFAKYKAFVQDVPNLIQVIEDGFRRIDATKFLPLFYQLAARIDASEDSATQSTDYVHDFQCVLQQMVLEICRRAPHQTLPVLYALTKNEQPRRSGDMPRVVNQSKVDQIQNLRAQLSAESDDMREHWDHTRQLLDAYVRLAKVTIPSDIRQTTLSQVMDGHSFDRFSLMPRTSVITSNGLVGITSFEDTIGILVGVTHPRLLKLRSTDGCIYKQILKGNKDDLRQDAVMQQLFVLSSRLLQRQNPALSIRNYRVVPLAPGIGIIEFVERTISVQDWHHTMRQGSIAAAFFRYPPPNTVEDGALFSVLKSFQIASSRYHDSRTAHNRQALIDEFEKCTVELPPVFRFFSSSVFPILGSGLSLVCASADTRRQTQ